MWDVVDLDDEAIEEYASNELLGQFLSNTVFRTGILCVILFNSLLIAVETDQELVSAMFYVGPLFLLLEFILGCHFPLDQLLLCIGSGLLETRGTSHQVITPCVASGLAHPF